MRRHSGGVRDSRFFRSASSCITASLSAARGEKRMKIEIEIPDTVELDVIADEDMQRMIQAASAQTTGTNTLAQTSNYVWPA